MSRAAVGSRPGNLSRAASRRPRQQGASTFNRFPRPVVQASSLQAGSLHYGVSTVFQNPLRGMADEFQTAFQIELFLDAHAVGFDGLDPQMQSMGDFAAAESLTDQFKDFQFA